MFWGVWGLSGVVSSVFWDSFSIWLFRVQAVRVNGINYMPFCCRVAALLHRFVVVSKGDGVG